MMAACRFGVVIERSELWLPDRRWRGSCDRLEFARGLGHAEQFGGPDFGTHFRGGLARLRPVKDSRDALAIRGLRGGRQHPELGRIAPVVQKIVDRGTLPNRDLCRQFASAARSLNFGLSFIGKVRGLLKIEPGADRAAFFIVGRMAQVAIDKAEYSRISAMR
ncbi:hypothetical protein UP09_01285 [Bradyrhizobium sp. LTSP885]|nr:hypothetical protein UP09_01285 [Bradyrhizobium sp. LTSP885]